MTIGVIIYIHPEGEILWRKAAEAGTLPHPMGDGAACRAILDEDHAATVRLVLPGDRVTSRLLEMPETSEENARAAVGFLMEDHLAAPLARTHLVSKKTAEGKRMAVAVAHADLENWLGALKDLDIRPDEAVVDYQMLAGQGETACLEVESYRYYYNGTGEAFVLDRATLLELESNGLAFGEDMPAPVATDLAGLFDRFAATAVPLNLLQGSYGSQASLKEYFKPLARIVALALVVFVFYLGHLGLEGRAWRQAADVLDQQAELLFKTSFPDTSRIVNIRAQLKSKLSGVGDSGGDEFMAINSRLFAVLEKTPEIQVEKLRFGSGEKRLYVSFSAGSFELLDAFKKQLAAGNLLVEDQGARQDGSRVSGDFALEVAS